MQITDLLAVLCTLFFYSMCVCCYFIIKRNAKAFVMQTGLFLRGFNRAMKIWIQSKVVAFEIK